MIAADILWIKGKGWVEKGTHNELCKRLNKNLKKNMDEFVNIANLYDVLDIAVINRRFKKCHAKMKRDQLEIIALYNKYIAKALRKE